MLIEKTYSSAILLIGAMFLAGCEATVDQDRPVDEPVALTEVTVTFASPADAEAAALSIERLDDGSTVLAMVGDGAAFEALLTDGGMSALLDHPRLISMDRLMNEPSQEPLNEKHGDPFSCEGHCGSEAPGGCFCDSWCILFGDCCLDYFDVC